MIPGRRLLSRPLSPKAFSAIVILVALAIFAAPLIDVPQLRLIALARTAPATIAIVGPSTIDAVSKCDRDTRTVAQMLEDVSLDSVIDLSLPGQTLSQSINLAAISSQNPTVTDVVLPVTHPATEDWTTPPYRELVAYKLVMPGFQTFAAADLSDFWNGISGRQRRVEKPYLFEGSQFPGYSTISATEFSLEKRLGDCPEVLTHNPAFTKSYFWWTNVQAQQNPSLFDLITDLQNVVTQSGKRFHVVALPENLDLLSRWDTSWRDVVREKQARFVATLRARGIDVIDLSDKFREGEFMQQWCACIHLSDAGRMHVAQAIVEKLPIRVGAVTRLAPDTPSR
jgi:hypothetical protein